MIDFANIDALVIDNDSLNGPVLRLMRVLGMATLAMTLLMPR